MVSQKIMDGHGNFVTPCYEMVCHVIIIWKTESLLTTNNNNIFNQFINEINVMPVCMSDMTASYGHANRAFRVNVRSQVTIHYQVLQGYGLFRVSACCIKGQAHSFVHSQIGFPNAHDGYYMTTIYIHYFFPLLCNLIIGKLTREGKNLVFYTVVNKL